MLKRFTNYGRYKEPLESKKLIFDYVVYILFNISFTVAVGVFLFCYETDVVCQAPNSVDDIYIANNYIDVSKRFNVVLCMYFANCIGNFTKNILYLIAIIAKNNVWLDFANILCINDCLTYAACIVVTIFRFQYSGKVCSGDYLTDDETLTFESDEMEPNGSGYLIRRGRLLYGIVVCTWVVWSLMGLYLIGWALRVSKLWNHYFV